MFSGYKATIFRDLPFSALQFAFYEQEQEWAKNWVGSREIGLPMEILTATTAGGMAGVLTCPLDVVKTRVMLARREEGTYNHVRVSDVVRRILKEEGPGVLWRGIGPRTTAIALGGAIFLGSYQWTSNTLEGGYREREEL